MRDDNLRLFEHIEEIVARNNGNVYLLASICKTTHFDPYLNAYHIKPKSNIDQTRFIKTLDLPYFQPFFRWSKNASKEPYVSLRRILL